MEYVNKIIVSVEKERGEVILEFGQDVPIPPPEGTEKVSVTKREYHSVSTIVLTKGTAEQLRNILTEIL